MHFNRRECVTHPITGFVVCVNYLQAVVGRAEETLVFYILIFFNEDLSGVKKLDSY